MKIADAHVLVTGGSSGIGKETARQLVARGAKVAVSARDLERLEAAAREIGAVAVQCDVSREDEVVRMVERTRESLGAYDVLVNNAAWGYFAPLVEIDRNSFEKMLATNLTGAMLVARESARHFVSRGGGHIVNVGSTASLKGFAGGSAYAASKFALRAMSECWRAELRKHDVRVIHVNPSEVITGFAGVAGYGQTGSARKLQPEDIAHTIVSCLEMHDRGFIPEVTVFATNPD